MKSNSSSSSTAASTAGIGLLGDRGDQLRLERLAGHRRRLERPAATASETAVELLVDRGDHRARDGCSCERGEPCACLNRVGRGRLGRAARCRTGCRRSRDRAAARAASSTSAPISARRPRGAAARARAGSRRRARAAASSAASEPRRRLAVGDRRQQRPAEPAQQVGQHLDRGGVGPVHVVEREQHRLARRSSRSSTLRIA